MLKVAGQNYSVTSDSCTGKALAPTGSCTFDLSLSAAIYCDNAGLGAPFERGETLEVAGPTVSYIRAELEGQCQG